MSQLERDLAAARVAEDLLLDIARRRREFGEAAAASAATMSDLLSAAIAATEQASEKGAAAVAAATAAAQALVDVVARQAAIEDAVVNTTPAHSWAGTQLRIRNPDGGWGPYVNLVGPKGDVPDHEWDGTRLAFEGPDGELQEGVDLVGPPGDSGWAPVLGVSADGERRVLRVNDWIGGEGTKPATGSYLGAGGFTSTIGDAVNVRGAPGPGGEGSGDMVALMYDPNEVQGDAFDMDNMSDGLTKVAMTPAERARLAAMEDGATANLADAALLDRAEHTGEQAISTVTGLQAALDEKAALASPTLTGTPAAPTPSTSDDSTKIATTAFVKSVIAAVLDTPPSTLDTLNEIAAALNDDPNFAATMTAALGGKVAKSMNLGDLPDIGIALDNLGFSANAKSLVAAANYAAMKTLLAIGVADISNASANGRSLISAANYAAMKALLDLEIGTDVQAYNAGLAAIAGLTTQSYGRDLLTVANEAALKALINLEIGVDVQAYDADTAKLDVEDQAQTGGTRVTIKDLGNLNGASITLDPGDRPHQKITNNGAGTLTAGSNYGDFWLDVHGTTGAGVLTIAGLTSGGLLGDDLDTDTTSIFQIVFSIHPALKTAYVTKIA